MTKPDDVHVMTAVPSGSVDSVRRHGLLSSKAMLENPEALKSFLAGRKGTNWEESEDEFRTRVGDKLKDEFWGTSVQGPSVFFGEPDPNKITDKHPSRKLRTEMLKINLSRLMRDQPGTRISGTELVPYDPDGPRHQGQDRHKDIDMEAVRGYASKSPEELWAKYNSPEGTHYASDVPHAQIITSTGGIDPKYIEKGAAGEALEQLKRAKYLSDNRMYKDKHQVLQQIIRRNPDNFFIDSQKGNIVGITHKPTNFQIHMPLDKFPSAFMRLQKGARDVSKMPYRPTAEAILMNSDGTLAAKIKRMPGKSFFKAPGGGIDPGESPEVGLRREIEEETGITPENLRLSKRVKWDWPENWVSTDKQRERYKQFRGEDSHIFTGDVGTIGAPTSQEGDAWDEPPSLNAEEAAAFLRKGMDPKDHTYQGPAFDKYKGAQLAALMAIMKKRQMTKQASIDLDIEVGDVILTGRYKNKRKIVEDIGTDELGQPTVNGMKLLAMRIEKKMPKNKQSRKTQDMSKESALDIKGVPEQPKSKEHAEAGTYRKGHARMHGLALTIENMTGQTRSGTGEDGKKWESTMTCHYGYIKRTLSDADGDHVDVFVGPDTESELVYVVNQVNPSSGRFDEHKCMLGFLSEKAAREGYLSNYEKGWKGCKSITPMTMPQFKLWLDKGNTGKAAPDFKLPKTAGYNMHHRSRGYLDGYTD